MIGVFTSHGICWKGSITENTYGSHFCQAESFKIVSFEGNARSRNNSFIVAIKYLENRHHHRRKPTPNNSSLSIFASSVSSNRASLHELEGFNSKPPPYKIGFNQDALLSCSKRRLMFRLSIPPASSYAPPQRAVLLRCYEWCKDTGIASEQDWGISLKNQPVTESGANPDGSSWYRESGEDLGTNGYRCRWTVMGGRNVEGSVEWKETWWEKCDWSGFRELGAEKSGRNTLGDSWWETWQETYRPDDSSGSPRIEKSAHKQAKSGAEGIWNEKWWEKYNAKGWTDKGAHKYGRLNDQSWWEKWGEQYDGQGAVVKWTDKWAENDSGTKWGDKWEERFNKGSGKRQGETWNLSAAGERWSRFWGEEHHGNGQVHKYGKSTSGELWDEVVQEVTHYESEPHYGWMDALANSTQLLAIEIRGKSETEGDSQTSEAEAEAKEAAAAVEAAVEAEGEAAAVEAEGEAAAADEET